MDFQKATEFVNGINSYESWFHQINYLFRLIIARAEWELCDLVETGVDIEKEYLVEPESSSSRKLMPNWAQLATRIWVPRAYLEQSHYLIRTGVPNEVFDMDEINHFQHVPVKDWPLFIENFLNKPAQEKIQMLMKEPDYRRQGKEYAKFLLEKDLVAGKRYCPGHILPVLEALVSQYRTEMT